MEVLKAYGYQAMKLCRLSGLTMLPGRVHNMIKRKKAAKRDVEREISRAEFVATLQRMVDALAAGEPFIIQVKGERIRIPRDAAVSIEHEREGGKEELEFQIKWERKQRR